jgi:hypothetical protein
MPDKPVRSKTAARVTVTRWPSRAQVDQLMRRLLEMCTTDDEARMIESLLAHWDEPLDGRVEHVFNGNLPITV